jgi:hypothetical protein
LNIIAGIGIRVWTWRFSRCVALLVAALHVMVQKYMYDTPVSEKRQHG